MYIYVVIQETPEYLAEPAGARVKARLEDASGEPCLLVPYPRFTAELMAEVRPRAVCFSGFGASLAERKAPDFLGVYDVMRRADLPLLCFCGSHQLLGSFYSQNLRRLKKMNSRNIRPMGKVKRGEDRPRRVPRDPGLEDHFCAEGFYPVTRLKTDPLFRGLPKTMIMRCAHYCEVIRLPKGFERIAESGHCRIAAMRLKGKPVYGVQFHPEAFEGPFLHGKELLENFARIVDAHWRDSQG